MNETVAERKARRTLGSVVTTIAIGAFVAAGIGIILFMLAVAGVFLSCASSSSCFSF